METELSVGDIVKQGELIGPMKRSTRNTLMLHLEILINYPEDKGFLNGDDRDKFRIDPTYVYDYPDF